MFEDKIKKIFIAIVFIIIAIPLVRTNFKSDTISTVESRMLANFPNILQENGTINTTFIVEFEEWFNDNIGYRDVIFNFNSKMEYDVFNSSPSEKVEIGKDGWLYFTSSYNVDIARGTYPGLTEKDLARICEVHISIQKMLKEKGIEYIIYLPPSKVSIYPEYLKGNFSIRETPVDIIANYLEQHSDIKIIRLKEVLLEAKSNTEELLYFKTDTHWNDFGAYIAYKEIIEKLNKWNIINDNAVEVEFLNDSKMCDLQKLIVGQEEKYYEKYLRMEVLEPEAFEMNEGETYEYIQEQVIKNNSTQGKYFKKENSEEPSFLFIVDSMSVNYLMKLMVEHASETTYFWGGAITNNLLDILEPDVVFWAMTERELIWMGHQIYED